MILNLDVRAGIAGKGQDASATGDGNTSAPTAAPSVELAANKNCSFVVHIGWLSRALKVAWVVQAVPAWKAAATTTSGPVKAAMGSEVPTAETEGGPRGAGPGGVLYR